MCNVKVNSLIQWLLSEGNQEEILSSVYVVELISALPLNAAAKRLVARLFRQGNTVLHTFSFNLGMIEESLVSFRKLHCLLDFLRMVLCNMLLLKT